MNIVGIIAEYNPLHAGHVWHLRQTRERLCAPVVVVMSGHVTQRGELAMWSKQARAEAAVRAGASLVIELPAPYVLQPADLFAQAGVALLEACGVVTHLSFGSECGDIEQLAALARLVEALPPLDPWLRSGMTVPAARQMAAQAALGHPVPALAQPNNILGLAYLRAIRTLTPVTFARQGAGHDSQEECALPSAAALRARVRQGMPVTEYVPYLPAEPPVILQERNLLDRLRRMTQADFAALPDISEGLQHRLYRAARSAGSLDEYYTAAKTRRYTLARLRRVTLCAYLGVQTPPPSLSYLRVLAVGQGGRQLLAHMRTAASLPVITRPAAVKNHPLMQLEARITDLRALHCQQKLPPCGQEFVQKPFIL